MGLAMTIKQLVLSAVLTGMVASPVLATPFAVPSWDGNPPSGPGDLRILSGIYGWEFGAAPFSAGEWEFEFIDAYAGWRGETTVRDSMGSVLLPPGPFAPFTIRRTYDAPWWMLATSPSIVDAPSTGVQWAWYADTATSFLCGLEDIRDGEGDGDYQDVRCRVTLVDVPPTVPKEPPVEIPSVPEPRTLVLVGLGLGVMCVRRWLNGE